MSGMTEKGADLSFISKFVRGRFLVEIWDPNGTPARLEPRCDRKKFV